MSIDAFPIVGAVGSPYSRKLRAVFRYRRIPHHWVNQGSPEAESLPSPKVALLPRLIVENEAGERVAKTDTSPLIRELERRFPDDRRVVPADPALAFLDALIEDYADEWLTKAMFHFRWAHAPDIAKARTILPRWFSPDRSDESLERAGEDFAARQIERLAVVGSNDGTAPVIEASYLRLLDLLEDHLRSHRFVLGRRPGVSDFALYGQLTQLALFDPTPAAIALERAPRVCAWTDLLEDLSGLEPRESDWLDRETSPAALRPLLVEIGRVYAPFLLANARSIAEGHDRVEAEIDGRPWIQKPFPYQAKCLAWLRQDYERLAPADRSFVDQTLAETGCEPLFAE